MVHSKLVTMEIKEVRGSEDLLMTSGGWIMSNSAVASLPAKVRIASSPPGWSGRNFVTFRTSCGRLGFQKILVKCERQRSVSQRTWPFTTTQQSSFVVCFATSSSV